MNIRLIEKKILSSDRIHNLYGIVLVPDGEIKGLFHVVHGMTEYIRRYEPFMRQIAEQGYIVFGYDHLGHGNTVNDDSELGFFAHKNGWKYLVNDVAVFGSQIKKEYGNNLRYILLGHSMGSFIVRLAAEKFNLQDKLIIMGTGGPAPGSTMGISLVRRVKKIKGEKYISNVIQNLVFGTYNKRFGYDDPYNWLSNIDSVRKAYAGDKYCNFKFTVSGIEDLLTLHKKCNSFTWFSSCVIKKPILLISGADDPVGDYGMGVKKVHDRLKENGADVRLILYKNCRHELLNDISREKVIADILSFCSIPVNLQKRKQI